jgi:hypothetical protein
MAEVDEKLRRGLALIDRADGDGDLLGAALLTIHGALEDYLHAALLRHPQVGPEDRQVLAERNQGWVPRANLAQKYGLLTREQRKRILEANDVRQAFAHGAPLRWRDADMRRYGQFVAELCGRQELLARERRRATAEGPARRAALPDRRVDPASRQRERMAMATRYSRFPRILIITFVVLALLLGGVALSRRYEISFTRIGQAFGLLAQPTSTPTAAPVPPTPTPRIIQARLVHLGAGPGWLHDTPDFTSPTLPIPLQEGLIVTVLEQQQADTAGNLWRHVSVGGYEGWCPDNNLEILP